MLKTLLETTGLARVPEEASGHLWTVVPKLWHKLIKLEAPATVTWSTEVPDPELGKVLLTGMLRDVPGSDTLVLVIHGIGGSPISTWIWDRSARRGSTARS